MRGPLSEFHEAVHVCKSWLAVLESLLENNVLSNRIHRWLENHSQRITGHCCLKIKRKLWISNCITAILVSLHNKCKGYNNWLVTRLLPRNRLKTQQECELSLGRKISYQLQRAKYRHVTNMVDLVSTGPLFTRHSLQSQFLWVLS